jgi:uncharacterized protein YrzB (UPF0473 family)
MSVAQKSVLRETYGDEIVLVDEQDESVVFRILAEFEHESVIYAALQSDELKKDSEVAFFRVSGSGSEYELETIEDDDEWETVSELYDELTFPSDDEL